MRYVFVSLKFYRHLYRVDFNIYLGFLSHGSIYKSRKMHDCMHNLKKALIIKLLLKLQL